MSHKNVRMSMFLEKIGKVAIICLKNDNVLWWFDKSSVISVR